MRNGLFVVTGDGLSKQPPIVISIDERGTTTAVIEVSGIIGVGVSRCRPEDHYNETIGISIATARAMKQVIESVEKTWVDRAQTKEYVSVRRANRRVLKM